MQNPDAGRYAVASFSGGSFWDLEAAFRLVEGVVSTGTGYSGGTTEHPSHTEVSAGESGHAETVVVGFDPAVVSYRDLLEVFFSAHDPTGREYEETAPGGQYRPVIWYHSPEQKQEAEAFCAEMDSSGIYDAPLVTAARPAGDFWPAEECHQHYYERLASYFAVRQWQG